MTTNNNRYFSLMAIAAFLIALFFTLVLASCNSERRATRLIHKSVRVNPIALSKECADRFPPIDSVNERTVFIPGKTTHDTVVETELEIIKDTVYVNKLRTVTVTKHDTVKSLKYVQTENKAALNTCNALAAKETVRADNAENRLKTWRIIGISAIVLIAIWLAIKIFK